MKRSIIFLLTFIVIAFGFANVSHADEWDDCDNDAECVCLTESDLSVDQSSIETEEDCESACLSLEQAGEVVTGYSVQCEIGGAVTTIIQGALSSDETGDIDSTTDPTVPNLSIEIPGLELTEPTVIDGYVESNMIGQYIEAVYMWVISAASILAVVMLMLGGLQYMLARGNKSKIANATKRIKNAVVGIILLLGAYTIAFIVDPSSVVFESLVIPEVARIDFEFANETPSGFASTSGEYALTSTEATGGIGWNDTVMYDQTDYPDVPYGEPECLTDSTGSIMSSGCGVTSYAMVASTILGENVDPPYVAGYWSEPGSCEDIGIEGYSDKCRACPDTDVCGSCNGTFGSAMSHSELAQALGVVGEPVGSDGYTLTSTNEQEILDALEAGDMLVSSYETSSGGGHFVVLVGLDSDGNILVNNPYGGMMETRDPDTYFSVIKSAYIFDR